MPIDQTIITQFISGGAIGVAFFIILWYIVVPQIKWMKEEIEKKDLQIKSLIEGHFASDLEAKEAILEALRAIRISVTEIPSVILKTVGLNKIKH